MLSYQGIDIQLFSCVVGKFFYDLEEVMFTKESLYVTVNLYINPKT